jgi:FkbM family methyltransferase
MDSSRVLLESGANRLVRGRHGYILYNRHDIGVGRFVEADGEYFESEVDLFRQVCQPGNVVVDAGANIGTHTLALSEIVGPTGRVFAIEPQRLVFQMLCANVALNGLTNVECRRAALGDHEAELLLGDPDPHQEINFGGVSLSQIPGAIPTPLLTLDNLRLPHVRLIKIDVEGMELDVLRGAQATLKAHQPILYMENNQPEKSEALLRFLGDWNYRSFWHMPSYFSPNNFFGNQQQLAQHLIIDKGGEFLDSSGIAINLLCLPREMAARIEQFREVADPREHPLKREHYKSFIAG